MAGTTRRCATGSPVAGDELSGRDQLRYRRLLRLAEAVVVWERLWPRLWPALGVAGAFVAVALLDVLPALPPLLHTAVVFIVVAVLALALRNAVIGFAPVARREARHRLEQDSGLAHRPLAALEDDLAAGRNDPAAQALWRRHRERMAATAERLRVRLPAPGMAGVDPCGLRAVVMLMLIVGMVAAGGQAGDRLWRALAPQVAVASLPTASIDVWVTPPAYTGMAPQYLKKPGARQENPVTVAAPILIPVGSTVLAQVHGLAQAPRLLIGNEPVAFTPLGAAGEGTGYRAEAKVRDGNRLAIRSGHRTLASWPVEVVPDRLPEVRFPALPDATAEGLLRVAYEAVDDHGVVEVTAVIHRDDGGAYPDGGHGIRVSMPLTNPGAPTVEGEGQHDLTAHSWAGQEVAIHLEAEDAAGQIGFSPVVSGVLPERVFTHPVARALIEQRKRLNDEGGKTRARVAAALQTISRQPERFEGDVVVSLALAVAQGRLLHDRGLSAVSSVRSILWETALRLEQGILPEAERRLSEARDRLQEALRQGADNDEIDVLADELQRALDDYLQAVADEMARQGVAGMPAMPMSPMMRGQDLQEIVDMARQLARAGAHDRARDLLAELQRIVDRVRSGFNASIQSAEELAEAQRLMEELRDVTQRQEALLDATFDILRRLESDVFGESLSSRLDSELAEGAAEQEALDSALGDLMSRLDGLLGGAPTPMGEARQAMGEAAAALRSQRLAEAVPGQTRAVERLRAAAQASAQMMAEQFGGGSGVLAIQPGGGSWGSGDPFGRFGSEGLRGLGIGDVEIPDGARMRHVEEIVRELRRRAGDQERPRLEREYIERLLRRF